MPLLKGKENFDKNVSELVNVNKSKPAGKKRKMDQILAIAYKMARS